ncbi:MAG TPA: DUF3043 domain-containing protein [Streptosporangiaceae bacterium]|nr:DUF3043 domain-containing protein [Streptosporangiaceae bacterium]
MLDQGPADEPEAAGPARPGITPAKGRPTPKRSEAEKNRRGPYTAPKDRKSAGPRNKAQDRADRSRRMEAMRRGEDWALPRKDQGPVKALARDVVDSRRGVSEYYLYGIVVLVAALFIPGLRQNFVVDYVILIILAVIIIEGWYVSNKVIRMAKERYPGSSTRGVRVYTALRGTQIRKMRVPAPRVTPKDKI